VLVRGGKIQRRERWTSTTHTWLKGDRVLRLTEWERAQFGRGRGAILFVLRANQCGGPGRFHFRGSDYHLLVTSAEEYAARMRQRSIAWDNKVQISAAEFEDLATPLAEWVERYGYA